MPTRYLINHQSIQKQTVYGYRNDGTRLVLGHRNETVSHFHKITTPAAITRDSKRPRALIECKTYKDYGIDEHPVHHPHLPKGWTDRELFVQEEYYDGCRCPKVETRHYEHTVEYKPPTCFERGMDRFREWKKDLKDDREYVKACLGYWIKSRQRSVEHAYTWDDSKGGDVQKIG